MKGWKLTKRGEFVRDVFIVLVSLPILWGLFVGLWFALGGE